MRRNEVEDLAVPSPDFSELGVADPYGIFQHGFKYWLKVPWGAADNLQHIDVAVCCCSDSPRSSVRWRNSLSSCVFSMAMTACAANVSTSSICFGLYGR